MSPVWPEITAPSRSQAYVIATPSWTHVGAVAWSVLPTRPVPEMVGGLEVVGAGAVAPVIPLLTLTPSV